MAPDECALREHLRAGGFQAGIADGRWRLVDISWPVVMIAVSAAERPNSPTAFALRLDMAGYPHTAPTGGLWDVGADVSLPPERRPKGEWVGQLFRADGWAGGSTAMYAPWDRAGLKAHPDWARAYPLEAWHPARDVAFILTHVHEALNNNDYLGI
jgi:hypothetical protein